MRPSSFALGALALVALAAAASAAEPPAPTLTAQRAAWEDAASSLDLLMFRDLDGSAAARLTAAHLHVRTTAAEAYSRTPDGDVAYAPRWTHAERDLSAVALDVSPGRAGSFLYVTPRAVQVEMACASAEPARKPDQVPSAIEAPNPNPVLDVSEALLLVPCGPVRICGSMVVSLWERDAAGASAEGPVHLESGQLARPSGPDARPFLGRAEQHELIVSDGCLSLDAPGAGASTGRPVAYARGATLRAASSVALQDARGTLPGAVSAVDGDLMVAGRLDAAVARDGALLRVGLAGTLASAAVDGAPLGLATAAPAPPVARWAWLASLGLALPVAGAAVLWTRANRPEALFQRAERAARGRDWSRVLVLTTRRLRRGEDPRTRILRAGALLELHDLPQALSQACLALVRLPDGPTKADAALVACRAASRLGRDQEALAWLGEVYAQDVRTAEHALRHPEVARLTTAQDVSYS